MTYRMCILSEQTYGFILRGSDAIKGVGGRDGSGGIWVLSASYPFYLSKMSLELLRPHRVVLIIASLSLKSESVNCSVVSESFRSQGW